jgi:hypothetical protein
MQGVEQEGKKAELFSRIDRLRELLSQDAPQLLLEEALAEVGRSLDGYTRPGRADGRMATPAGEGEASPGL